MENLTSYVLLGIFAVAVAVLFVRVVKYRSWSGALLGAAVNRTEGHALAASSLHMPVEVRVHALSSPTPYRAVGLELVEKVALRYRVMPVTLSAEQARHLAQLLLQAADTPPNNSSKPTPLRGAA
ncbi:hypothetical protein [Lysobacter sp. HA35]